VGVVDVITPMKAFFLVLSAMNMLPVFRPLSCGLSVCGGVLSCRSHQLFTCVRSSSVTV
jgi:hypothetical protein